MEESFPGAAIAAVMPAILCARLVLLVETGAALIAPTPDPRPNEKSG